MAKLKFDKSKAAPISSYSSVPKGIYEMIAEACEVTNKENSSGELTHQVLKVTCRITDGPYKNRKIFPRFNLVNPSHVCVGISQSLLAKLVEACGFFEIDDSDELIGKHFSAEVIVKPPKAGYSESNDIVNYYQGDTENKFESNNQEIKVDIEQAPDFNELDDFNFDFNEEKGDDGIPF